MGKAMNRRSDRLFSLIQILRDGRRHRAEDMARKLGVTVRTIYRDMEAIVASGVPVEGTRGRGYRAAAAVTLPPLNLSMTELEALHLGLAAVGSQGDDELSQAARSVSAMLDAALPEDRLTSPAPWGLAIYPFADAARGLQHLPNVRRAIRERLKLWLLMSDVTDLMPHRVVRPLQLEYWGRLWTLTVWCETAVAFDVIRLDLVDAVEVLDERFVDEPDKGLETFLDQLDQL